MSTVAASAHAYLQQLARTVKRPIMWAFCFGLTKTAVIVIQLAIVASLAHELFVHGRGLVSLLHLFIWLVVFSFARAGIGLLQNACLRLARRRQATMRERGCLPVGVGKLMVGRSCRLPTERYS